MFKGEIRLKTKKRLKTVLIILWTAFILAMGILAVAVALEKNVFYHGQLYPKNQTVLDIREKNLTYADYCAIAEKLPDTIIIWTAPLSGGAQVSDQTEITVTDLTSEDVDMLATFPDLRKVQAEACTNYPELMALQKAKPECSVSYRVKLGGKTYSQDAKTVLVPGLNREQATLLNYLPCLERVDADGCTNYALLLEVANAHPMWQVEYRVRLGEDVFAQDTVSAAARKCTYVELQEKLTALPELKELILVDPEASKEELAQLREAYPEVRIHWQLDILGVEATDETVELDLSGVEVTSLAALEQKLERLPLLEKVIMSDCGLDNETMAAFREKKRADYKVVWTVHFTSICKARTDDIIFMPIQQDEYLFNRKSHVENLRYCEDMICVDLGHAPISDVSWAAYMPHLKYLILAHTEVKDISPLSSCKELVFLELDHSLVKDYSPLLGCTALEDLNLGKTSGSEEPILKMTWLKNLWWMGAGGSRRLAITEALPDTNLVIPGNYTVGQGWRKLPNYYAMRDLLGMPYMN